MGTESLKSPYKMIAADVDNNNDITAIDLLEITQTDPGHFMISYQRAIQSWKFIPKSYTFSDASNLGSILLKMYWLIWQKNGKEPVGVKIGE